MTGARALLTDLYQLTMAYGYWKTGRAEDEAVFNLSFRKAPFGSGYTVACGLAPVIDLLDEFRFLPDDLAYLATLTGNDGGPLFEAPFLDFLGGLRLTVTVHGVPEGTVVFPQEPLLRVAGPLLQCQLLETGLLNLTNFDTLVATKAARVCLAARGDPVLEFGLRRAQGPEAGLAAHVARLLGLPPGAFSAWRILRKSLDTRDKSQLRFVYTLEVELPEARPAFPRLTQAGARHDLRVEPYDEPLFEMPRPGTEPLPHRPVVVGSGPAGLVAAYFLAEQGYLPLVLERGRAVRERIHDVHAFDAGGPLDPESNYLFGEGGAGTFSDGKLTCRSTGPDVRRVLELFAECKGKPSILYDYRPHLGSNRLPAVVKAIRREILARGGEVRFGCRVEDVDVADGLVRGLMTSSGLISASVVVLATGHSARDTLRMLHRRGIPMTPKPFQMGVRIETPQELVNRIQYGPSPLEQRLGAADYSLVARGRHNLFTFCMCAGGHIIPSVSAPGYFSTNGMSLSGRDSPFANSGLMITVEPSQFGSADTLGGLLLQEAYERKAFDIGRGEYACPIQRAPDFLVQRVTRQLPACSYLRKQVLASIAEVIPPFIVQALHEGLPIMDHRWQGRFLPESTLVGPEARGSSPVRLLRDAATLAVPGIPGLYPIGEGAGYAGGIVSAAVDGLRAAKAIIARYAPPR